MSGTALGNLVGLIGVFEKYASRDKDSNYLNKSELKELLENEFPMLVNESSKPEDVNKIMVLLDLDRDGQVDIQEYFVTLCSLGVLLSREMKDQHYPKRC